MIDKEPLEQRLHRYLDERDAERPPIGLEDRIIRIVRDEPRRRSIPTVRGQAFAAAAIAVVAIGLAAGVAYVRGHSTASQGPGPSPRTSALSIGTQGGGDWVVVRGIDYGTPGRLPGAAQNGLYHTSDGGQTWQDRLHFDGNYDGMSWSGDGKNGVLWTRDMTRPCGTASVCYQPSQELLTVYSTTDGGLHWTQHPAATFGAFSDVYFKGVTGWVLTRFDSAQGQTPTVPEMLRTTDGGTSWTKVADLPDLTGLQLSGGTWGYTYGVGQLELEFADTKHGWLATGLEGNAGDSGLLETTDGGKTWHSVAIEPPASMTGEKAILGYPVLLADNRALLPVYFGHRTDPNNFSIDHRFIYSSADGGSTWTSPRALNANGVQPTGYEWQTFYLDDNRWWFTAINARSAGEPVAQAGPAVARTTDGGNTWQVFSGPKAPTILQLTFTDAEHGWALAITGPDNTNILLRTTDGGAHWHQVQIP
jgi:photosystem II stability/assembly factor-like uncharacterized protein